MKYHVARLTIAITKKKKKQKETSPEENVEDRELLNTVD